VSEKPGARLIKYEAARQALAEAHRVDEAKDIRDKAMAVRLYARQAKDRDMITWATEIKIRAERRVGQLLREMEKHPGLPGPGRGRKTPSRNGDRVSGIPTLRQLHISPDQSSDWQRLAAIPEPEFEKRLAAASGDPATMTTAKLLRPAPAPMKENPFEEERKVWASVSGWLGRVRDITPLEHLKRVRPTGGAHAALMKNLTDARTYVMGLDRLHEEGWI
jgi:hypothetical protein